MNIKTAEAENVIKSSKRNRKKAIVAYSFIAPNFIGFAIFTLIPMVFAMVLSLMEWNGVGSMTFVGFNNFARLFKDAAFIKALKNTLIYTVAVVPLTMVVALSLAMLLNLKIKGRNFFRTVSFFPYVASLVAVATVWRFLFTPSVGTVNMILSNLFHVDVSSLPRWTSANWPALAFAVIFSIWKNMGYYMVIYLAGLQGVNTELYESAALDGANKWQRFTNVTLPQISATNFFVLMMMIISSFKAYDIFLNLFAGGDNQLSDATRVLVYQIYNMAFRILDYGYASAMAIILFFIVLGVTLVQFYVEGKYSD